MKPLFLSIVATTVLCCIAPSPSFAAVVNVSANADVDIRSSDLSDSGFDRTVMVIGNGGGDPATQRNFKGYIRFALPADFGTANSATFEITRAVARSFNAGMNVSGLDNGTLDEWLEVDGTNIGPLGSNPNDVGTSWNNSPGNIKSSGFEFSNSSLLGTFSTLGTANGGASGDTYSITGAGLVNFLNQDTNGLVTLMLGRNNVSSQQEQWASNEHGTLSAPVLKNLDYTPVTTNWATEASNLWDTWRQARSGVMPTASWSFFIRYDGTVAEYNTYRGAGLNMVNVPRLPLPSFSDPAHQYGNAITAGGLGVVLGQFENLHENPVELLNAIQLAESSGGSVIGYTLEDEPEPNQFANLAEAHRYIYRYDSSGALPMVNLLPNWAWGDSRQTTYGIDYDGYVQKFIDDVNPAVLMHTHYPTLANGTDRPEYYSNLELFRDKGLANDIGVMGFVLVTDHTTGPYRRPSASDLRWQVNSHLAYGAKGIYYYNYRIGDASFGEGLVDDTNGNPTDQYPRVLAINDSVQDISPVMMQLTSTGVYHTGASLPADTTQYTTAVDAPIHDFLDDDFVVGVFENEDVISSDRYVFLVNKLHDAALDSDPSLFQTASFTLDAAFNTVFVYDSEGIEQLLLPSGTFGGRDLFEYGLEGGEGALIRLTFLAGVTGDYNGNGIVDAADYTIWRDTFGSTTNLAADGNGNSVIDQLDYDVWVNNFGNSTSSEAGSTTIPEPASFALLMFSAAAISLRRTNK